MDKYSYMQPSTILKNEHGEIYTPKNYYEKIWLPSGNKGKVFTLFYRNDDIKKVANEFHEVANTLSNFAVQLLDVLKSNQEVTQIMIDNFYRQVWLYKTTLMKAYLDEEKHGFYISDNFSLYALSVSASGRVRKILKGSTGKRFKENMIKYKGKYDKSYFKIKPIIYKSIKSEKQISDLAGFIYNKFLPTAATISTLFYYKLCIKSIFKYLFFFITRKDIDVPVLKMSSEFTYEYSLYGNEGKDET